MKRTERHWLDILDTWFDKIADLQVGVVVEVQPHCNDDLQRAISETLHLDDAVFVVDPKGGWLDPWNPAGTSVLEKWDRAFRACSELSCWLQAMQVAVLERDASMLASLGACCRRPPPLAGLVCEMIEQAPWRDAKPGRRRRIPETVRSAICHRYGDEIASGRPRDVVLDEIAHQFSYKDNGKPVSRATLEAILAKDRQRARQKSVDTASRLKARFALTFATAEVARAQNH